jgi:hypothetical protein
VFSDLLQDGRASYDAAGRMASYTDWGTGGMAVTQAFGRRKAIIMT